MENTTRLTENIAGLREEIIKHRVYSAIEDMDDLRIFMQFHVYAVWDFMSLLKSLQRNLTCTTLPWFPVGSADSRYLINEIVLGEESDVDAHGVRKSHFEMYLDAMKQCGADVEQIHRFIHELQHANELKAAFTKAGTPQEAIDFVDFTFQKIHENKSHVLAAIFTFGREDLIPDMFMSIVNDIDRRLPGSISAFKYYLERHIEVDGDHHSHLALQMTQQLCSDSDGLWAEAEEGVIASLNMRMRLWDGAYAAIQRKRLVGLN